MNEKIYNIYKVQKWMKYLPILFTFHFSLFTSSAASAQKPDSIRVFDDEHPLVYEDAWDLWPYVFLNENGPGTCGPTCSSTRTASLTVTTSTC